MAKGCLYTDLDDLRTEYRYKMNIYADKLRERLNGRERERYEALKERYYSAYVKLDKLIITLKEII